MTMAAGLGALEDEEYTRSNCRTVIENREYAAQKLKNLGFTLTDSKANFLFAKHERLDGGDLYKKLRERGILIRHFTKARVSDYNRITVGSRDEMDALISAISDILEETK
jgi:histidinol-phosphate aminotransferase